VDNALYAYHTIPASPLMEMPQTAQIVFLALTSVTTLICLIYGAVLSKRNRTALPVLFVVGGFCTILLEPIGDVLGHAVHPQIGQIPFFEALDRRVPLHIAFLYSIGFGIPLLALFPRMNTVRLTSGFVWKSFFWLIVGLYAVEIIPIHFGLWGYFGKQALWIWKGGMPLAWIFINTTVNIVPAALIYLLLPHLNGLRQFLVIPIILIGATGAWTGTGAPFLVAINSDAAQWIVESAGILSVLLVLATVGACAKICDEATERRSADTVLLASEG